MQVPDYVSFARNLEMWHTVAMTLRRVGTISDVNSYMVRMIETYSMTTCVFEFGSYHI